MSVPTTYDSEQLIRGTTMSVSIPIQEAIFAFTSGLTFREYLAHLPPDQRHFLGRRYEMVRLDPDTQSFLTTYPLWLYLVLLVSEDAPDTMMVLPIVQRMAESSPRIDLRIVSDEADLLALNELLEDEIDLEEDLAEIELPMLFFFDEEWNQQAQWGARPEAAEERLDAWLTAHPDYEMLLSEETNEASDRLETLTSALTNQMRLWYNDDLTMACIREIRMVLEDLTRDSE